MKDSIIRNRLETCRKFLKTYYYYADVKISKENYDGFIKGLSMTNDEIKDYLKDKKINNEFLLALANVMVLREHDENE